MMATEPQHYLDDFITAGAPVTKECQTNMTCLTDTCEQLGVPLAPHKSEGSAMCLKFLGIKIDTTSMELQLPTDKLLRLLRVKKRVQQRLQRELGHNKDLELLVRLLQHAAKVVMLGRHFVGESSRR